jgi:DNA-binding transcriptional regulator WhiA
MYSGDAKDEIARVRFERECCPAAFLRASARFSGGGAGALVVSTERGSVARAVLAAAKAAGFRAAANHRQSARLGKHVIFEVNARGPLAAAARTPVRSCCRRAWLRGAFLACGSVSDPARGYHLEFFCRDDASARALCEVLAALGVDAAVSRRRGRPLAYVKGAQEVADILGQMGASQAVFALDNVRALRQTKNAIKRIVNSESANAARAATSSARQRDAAMRAIDRLGLGRLAPSLAQAAQLRIAHPDLTMAELAARARPRVTKSTMAYRMRALERLSLPRAVERRSARKPRARLSA